MRCRLCTWLILLLAAFAESSVQAEPLFRRSPRPNAPEHVPALIKTLSSDFDERRRADAAAELRDYDPKTFPEMIPALVEALKNDSCIPVRREAATSIGKLRPISQVGGYALEQAEINDPAIGVRAIATTHLKIWVFFYGYRRGRMPNPLEGQTMEPPLADPLPGPLPKLGPPKTTSPMFNSSSARRETPRPVPPLIPTQTTSSPKNDRFIFQLMSRLKPDVKPNPVEVGPLLNLPR